MKFVFLFFVFAFLSMVVSKNLKSTKGKQFNLGAAQAPAEVNKLDTKPTDYSNAGKDLGDLLGNFGSTWQNYAGNNQQSQGGFGGGMGGGAPANKGPAPLSFGDFFGSKVSNPNKNIGFINAP